MEMFWLRFVTFHNVAEKRKSKLLWKWQSSVETRFFADEFIKCQCCVAAPSWTNFRLNQCSQLFIANANHFPKKFQVPILVKLVSSLCSEFIYNYFWIQLLLVYTAKVGNTVAISIWLISNYYTSFLNIWTELFGKLEKNFSTTVIRLSVWNSHHSNLSIRSPLQFAKIDYKLWWPVILDIQVDFLV